MMPLLWNWSRKNFSLLLLLTATSCLALALGELVRGITWSLLMPVTLSAVLAAWGLSTSRLNPKQAWFSLSLVGITGVFVYAAGLARPLGRLILAMLALIPQFVLWMDARLSIDAGPLLESWAELSGHVASVLIRLAEWLTALLSGEQMLDPLAAGLVWSLLLWLVGAWGGWQLHRHRRAFVALAPGGALLALVLDYTRKDVGLVILYLAILLVLMGLARNEWLHEQWQRRKVDYSDSIAIETLIMVGLITAGLVFLAAMVPSLSWRDLVDRLREKGKGTGDRVAESLGLEAPLNAANNQAYRASGLPRQHLLGMPPKQLEDVVMIISTGELPPIPEMVYDLDPNRYYWRAITYDVYSGVGWSSSSAQSLQFPANSPLLELPQDYRILNQHIKRTAGQKGSVVWTGILAQADVDIEIAWRLKPPAESSPVHNGDMLGALTEVEEYTVISYLPQLNISQLRSAGSDYPAEIARRYLQLPETTPERVLGLARELTQAELSPYERAASIESHLRTFPYTLEVEPPPPGRDVVDYFLFTARQGYCDYYASSMVVLARAVGLPARVVVGYASGEYNKPTAEYIVRQKDAHTWVEIYFSGIGWVEFEPTAGQPSIGRVGDGSASEPPPRRSPGKQAIAWLRTGWRTLVTSLGGQLFIAGTGFALVWSLWQAIEIGILYLLPAPRAIARIYSRLEKSSARLLPDLPGGHTPYQLQLALNYRLQRTRNRLLGRLFSALDMEVENLVALYVAQVFSAHPPLKSQVSQGIRAWARLRWRLWIAVRWVR
jgi:transglutaminase-like putative cysteine protease/uncharacterized membrane protein YidH (DUF202 family)